MVTAPILMKLVLSTVFLILVLGQGPPSTLANPRSSYGEFCNKTIKCDSRAWLGCFDGTCDCLKEDEMLYDQKQEKCVSKAGERCKYALEEDSNTTSIVFEVTSCVPNALCNSEGICVCGSKYHENSLNGTCTFSRLHSEFCDSQNQCSVYQGLQCQEGTCRCNETVAIFSTKTKNHQQNNFGDDDSQCVGLAGHSCLNSQCTPNATCHQNTCHCDDGFYQNSLDNTCWPKIGPLDPCQSHQQCQHKPGLELKCIDGVCNCNLQFSQFATAQKAERYRYDPDIFKGFLSQSYTQCVGLAGHPCMDRLCVPRAYCSYSFLNDFSGTCKCLPSYFSSKSGKCGHAYGESCDSPDSCLDGFVCKDRICTCQYDNQAYDEVRKICFSKVGGPCNHVDDDHSSPSSGCGENAECILVSVGLTTQNHPNNETTPGHCQCKQNFVENRTGDCEMGNGGPCQVTKECDSVAGLKCINNLCQCSTFSMYSDKYRKCVGKVGSKCQVDEDHNCVENARCVKNHPKLLGTCTCLPPFVETKDYRC